VRRRSIGWVATALVLLVACGGVVDQSPAGGALSKGDTSGGGGARVTGSGGVGGAIGVGNASGSGYGGYAAVDAGPAPDEACWFEPLGYWNRCAESSPLAAASFGTASDCAIACRARSDCTSILDYTWIDPSLGCTLQNGAACTPTTANYYSEDAGLEYRKVCSGSPSPDAITTFDDLPGLRSSPTAKCRFVSVGDWNACESALPFTDATGSSATLEECLLACTNRSDCTAVQDFFPSTMIKFECRLHTSTCDAPVPSPPQSGGPLSRFYKKVCSAG
jgi:hypothetical protein